MVCVLRKIKSSTKLTSIKICSSINGIEQCVVAQMTFFNIFQEILQYFAKFLRPF